MTEKNRLVEDKILNSDLQKLAQKETQELFTFLHTSHQGLSSEEAEERLDLYGYNKVDSQKPLTVFQILWKSICDTFILVMLALMTVSFLTEDIESALVMLAMVSISILISFLQEYKSQKASIALKELIENTATVYRGGLQTEIPMDEVVPGDLVKLATGDMIPADSIIVEAKDLFINQSSLTGESIPVEKTVENKGQEQSAIFDQQNLIFMGSDVISGAGKALVLKTGQNTLFGDIATKATEQRVETSFSNGLNAVSNILLRLISVLFPMVFLLNGFLKGDWLNAFFFAIAVAVGLTPEMLPMIVTSNLAKGANLLAKEKVIVKELAAIQNLGSMDILCTDKTGTITEDRVVLLEHLDLLGESSLQVLEYAFLNSYYQTGWKNLMDVAVIDFYQKGQTDQAVYEHHTVDEIPFDFSRRRMSLVIDEGHNHLMITKGAIEEMIAISSHISIGHEVKVLGHDEEKELIKMSEEMNEKGMRVLAVAIKHIKDGKRHYSPQDESHMTLMGLIGFLDPAKASAKGAIKELHDKGVAVKVLTGDNPIVAAKVCEDVGIENERYLLGSDIDRLPEEELKKLVQEVNLFAKCTPNQKSHIIKLLQDNKHTVGFMGDGINDAPALRTADVGISVDTAADITKDASSIILLEKSLHVLAIGVLEGRRVFENMMKYIKLTLSSNFGNVFSILIASIFLPFLPMLSMQLLVQNLIYDISQLTIPWDKVDEEAISKPVKWDVNQLWNFTLKIGPVSSVFDIISFLVLWYVIKANTLAEQSVFQAGWFIVGICTQVLVVHIIRTKKKPFINSRASLSLILSSLFAILTSLFIVISPYHTIFDFGQLPALYWPIFLVIVTSYLLLVQLIKQKFLK
ncbi:magnesium-translocating P-type ATPase [Streptococcus catagoni]|uniref:magnesium-translocating P-type ATPase n=1 Tax=Streptococcus catagoni TaxID=2654874 RepID=UPI00140C0D84|nr:magnesium-translocating P-type ATPase [Streptococcus catagoni]